MWHSEADIMNDLAALNDFGDTEDTEPYKILCSIGRGSKTKPDPEKCLDSRIGDEIKSSDGSMKMEDVLQRGKGRGSALGARNYVLLQKQLRLARPLGSSDKIVESHFPKNTPPTKSVTCDKAIQQQQQTNTIAPQECSDKSRTVSSSKVSHRIKGVRSSNTLNNALIASLLKTKEISLEDEKSKAANELESLDEGDGVIGYNLTSADVTKSANESFSLPISEDPSLESTRVCSESCTIEEILGEMKDSGDKRPKPFSIDLTENFYNNIDFSRKEDNRKGVFKNRTGINSSSDSENTDERGDIDEQYKKLGERLNRIEIYNKRRKERERRSESSSLQDDSTSKWSREGLTVVTEELDHFDNSNFPPLVSKN